MTVVENDTQRYLVPNGTLTSGITIADGTTTPIVSSYREYGLSSDSINHSQLQTVTLKKAISGDAALGFGEWIASFPLGRIRVLGSTVKLLSSCPTGLSATAGEVGLGTAIATGAIATLGAGTATMENIMEGTTLANHVAAVPLTSVKGNNPVVPGTSATDGGNVLGDGINAPKIHLNIASTWDQTSAESVSFSALIDIYWVYLGTGS